MVAIMGAVFLVLATVTMAERDDSGNNLFTPLAFAVGAALVGVSLRLPGEPGDLSETARVRRSSLIRGTLVLMVVVGCLFWEVSIYANRRGTQAAKDLVASLVCRPDVTLYSVERLPLGNTDVVETIVSSTMFRYDGLKLLLHNDNRYFLLPTQWSADNAWTLVVNDDDATLIEFRRPCAS